MKTFISFIIHNGILKSRETEILGVNCEYFPIHQFKHLFWALKRTFNAISSVMYNWRYFIVLHITELKLVTK